ncbi:MAG TPA: three-Cys-motif partner protein TcmP [Terriglobia bacterium]|nr:three-Cys-motif partner protein TcmP [Terriglobia bacterium]
MSQKSEPGSDGFVARASGKWAKEKLYYLEHYLKIFTVGMGSKWRGKLYYLDLFAGPGKCRIRDTGEEIDGSPLIALKFNFAKYFFIEADEECYQALTARVRVSAPEKANDVEIVRGDCNEKIPNMKLPEWSLGLAFIDPTGVSPIAFDTIRSLAKGRKIDLIINFPEAMGIRMNLHQYTETEKNALNRFMGSARWQESQRAEPTSFDAMCKQIADEYLENLKGLGYLAVDNELIPVKTDKNALLYYLLFASKDPRGNDFWRKIVRIDSHGQRNLFR